ncbi:paraben-hydrolyzing esterase precursor [Venturia nashicola]|nr:paraben-hydrolyzing esterase precursor [Venturia nashicola]
METATIPYPLDLQFRGFVEGSTIKDKSSGRTLCHYFGGIPYALPPIGPFRWQRPRPLEPCYRYGTRANPGRYTGAASVCPQPGKPSPLFDEDCLQCNIWTPEGEAPAKGWPVYFYIHGGFLQFGNANTPNDPTALLSSTPFKAIIVKPAYRLNLFGFLAARELSTAQKKSVGNMGFWDLRLALEWTYKNINYFGGDPTNITIGGYSAGAHCAFYQLTYDLDQPPQNRLIKRIIMHSNGPGVPPKSLEETQLQFNELLSVLSIPQSLPFSEKLALLRSKSSQELMSAIPKMKLHQFRAITDGDFIKPSLFPSILNGSFAAQVIASNVQIIIGDCTSEHHIYALHRPAPSPSATTIFKRLEADYPVHICQALSQHYSPTGQLPPGCKNWPEAFGKIYADIQIHATQRGFISSLYKHGAGHLIHRYRINWRSKTAITPKKFGPTHGADMALWFYGDGKVVPKEEEQIMGDAFIKNLSKFVKGERMEEWQGLEADELRYLKADGTVEIRQDEAWTEGLKVWQAMMEQPHPATTITTTTSTTTKNERAKL